MKAKFSQRALTIAQGMLSSHPQEICGLLDEGRAVDLGVNPETGLHHRLVYSLPDRKCVVVLQAKDGTVARVLSVRRHNKAVWLVTPEVQVEARRLACPGDDSPWEPRLPKEPGPARVETRVVHVTARCHPEDGAARHTSLGKWPLDNCLEDLQHLGQNPDFVEEVLGRAQCKGFSKEALKLVVVHVGKRGDWVRVWPEEATR